MNKVLKSTSHSWKSENLLLRSSSVNANGIICNGATNEINGANSITEYLSLSSPSQKQPKILNNPLSLHPFKQINSPSPNITCICNCSTFSQTQSDVQTPLSKSKYLTKAIPTLNSIDLQSINEQQKHKKAFSVPKIKNGNYFDTFQNINSCKCRKVQRPDLDIAIQKHFGDIIQTIKNTIDKSEVRLRESERREIIQNEWSDVAMVLDRLLCYFFSISTLLICFIIFLNSPHSLTEW